MSNDDPDVDEVKAEFGGSSAGGDRLDAAREAHASGHTDLKASILEALDAIEDGDRQKTVSLWDENLAALFAGLEAHDGARRDVAEALATALAAQGNVPGGIDLEMPHRSDVLRLALLYALNDAAPEYVDVLRKALQERAGSTV